MNAGKTVWKWKDADTFISQYDSQSETPSFGTVGITYVLLEQSLHLNYSPRLSLLPEARTRLSYKPVDHLLYACSCYFNWAAVKDYL